MSLFREWLSQPLGQRLIALEAVKIKGLVPTLFGYDAVILGNEHFLSSLKDSPIKRHTVVNPECNYSPGICARYDKLPLATESLDLIYLAHCLEFVANPHEVLREANRALRPDGQLLITMFNPWSTWGLLRATSKTFWKSNFISLLKLRDWLALLGFDIMRVNRFAFMLPIARQVYPQQHSWFEREGQKLELPLAGAYVIQASKRIIPLTPLMPRWQEKPQSAAAIEVNDGTEPTT